MIVRSASFRFSLVLLISLMPCVLLADRAATRAGGGSVTQWQLGVSDYDHVLFTVSTPSGEVYVREFQAGEPVSFDLKNLAHIDDGQYTYQLTVVPRISPRAQKLLQKAREAGDVMASRSILRSAGIGEPIVETGGFLVENGAILAPAGDEEKRPGGIAPNARPTTPVTNDQVIPDDLIVQGSICAGLDCVNNEDFGYDTIRVKENNTRIQFNDTSVSPYPTNNWQIRANSSASGGTSFLGFVDQGASSTSENGTLVFAVEAGTAANSLYVDSTGRVGFRTSTPVLDLHVNTSNTPALRLEQNNSGGFTAQTWDIGANEANFFVRDVTGGSTLPFRIRPGAPTSSVDIRVDGEVGIGGQGLDVTGTLAAETHTDASVHVGAFAGTPRIIFGGTTTQQIDNNAGSLRFFRPGAVSMVIDSAGDVGMGGCSDPDHDLTIGGTGAGCNTGTFSEIDAGEAQFTVSSSRELKENLNEVRPAGILEKVASIPVYTYDFKDGKKDRLGLIAEDFYPVFERGSDKMLSGHDVQMALWLAVQELAKHNEQLSEQNQKLNQQNQQLNERINEIEKVIREQ